MKFSRTSKAAGASGFHFDNDKNTPQDAVDVSSADVYTVLKLPAGSGYDFDPAGKLTVTAPPAVPAAELMAAAQADALSAIDASAGAARARYITVAPGQEAVYVAKESQARAFKAAGYPAGVAGYPMVLAEAQAINGDTPTAAQIQAAADGVIAQADAWIGIAAQIERARIGGKRAVTAALDVAAVSAARAAAVGELSLL
jgi:hypothetical protein